MKFQNAPIARLMSAAASKTGPLRAAGIDPCVRATDGVEATIRRALSAAGLLGEAQGLPKAAPRPDSAIVGIARRVARASERTQAPAPHGPAGVGTFSAYAFSNAAGSRNYKLYVPAAHAAEGGADVPLVVMLHGCTQTPDDFAAGTRMNALAERHGFLVVYPAQAANANGSKCWNWFRPEDQQREGGEPAIIAGIVREVAASHRVDPGRVFAAGLSAGAAMAVVLGVTHPELFAAVGAHSGLPYAAAHDMASAFAAMQGGGANGGSGRAHPAAAACVPTIVFHGDSDRTVDARNGDAIVAHAAAGTADAARLRATADTGATAGRSYVRTLHADASGKAVVEQWLVHGAGHAWSGGSAQGSFTDGSGPDASAEMVRFFLAQRPGSDA